MLTRISNLYIFLLLTLGLLACKKEYMVYDDHLKDGIYFPNDSLNFQFGMEKGEDFNFEVEVRVLGFPKDYDRTFSFEVLSSGTSAKEEIHYNLPKDFVIPANEVSGNISFTLHRYLDPAIAEVPVVIKMKLYENENFRTLLKDTCKLEFSDKELPRPRWWSEYYFGPYSQLLMIDILNTYWDLEISRPQLFDRIQAEYGRDLERAFSFPFQQEIAFIKYIITPLYEHYLNNPNPKVNLPDPETLL